MTISAASVSHLIVLRKKTTARLQKIKQEEALFRQTLKVSASALRQARQGNKPLSWDDRSGVLQMVEDIIAGVMHIMMQRSADLEPLLDGIDKLAAAELPPEISWEWPAASETLEH